MPVAEDTILWRLVGGNGEVMMTWTLQDELRDRARRRDHRRYDRAMRLHATAAALDAAGAPPAVVARAAAAARRAAREIDRRLAAAETRRRQRAVAPTESRIVRRAPRAPHVARRPASTTAGDGSDSDSDGDPPPLPRRVLVEEQAAAERARRRLVLSSSVEQTWDTPDEILDRLRRVGPIGLDPCASRSSVVGARVEWRLDRDGDSLARIWAPVLAAHEIVYVNPPFGTALRQWMQKVADEHRAGAEIVTLTPARTDTRWWHDHVLRVAAAIAFLRGRVRFRGARHVAPFPVAISLYTIRPERVRAFVEAFAACAAVVVRDRGVVRAAGTAAGTTGRAAVATAAGTTVGTTAGTAAADTPPGLCRSILAAGPCDPVTPTAFRSGEIPRSCVAADRISVAAAAQLPETAWPHDWTGSCDRRGAMSDSWTVACSALDRVRAWAADTRRLADSLDAEATRARGPDPDPLLDRIEHLAAILRRVVEEVTHG